tara:strand:+ start:12833 stop:14218 length:1386 start_codon:yes stop_codon:yes gene_type:complete
LYENISVLRLISILTISTLLFLNHLITYSQEKEKIQFHLLGQDDNMSFLSDQEDKTAYESMKWIDLKNQNSISFGGGYRFQIESFINANFSNQQNQDNIWYLNRLMFHSLVKLGSKFEFYGELNSSTAINKSDISPVDKDVLSVNQAFIKYTFNPNWSVLVGRENLRFGTRRLVDIREGPNVRRSFDVTRLNYSGPKTSISAFFSIPVKPKPEVFDNSYLKFDEIFTGFYATKNLSTSLNFDSYGFYQKDDNVTYNVGTANEKRYSFGTRFFGTINKFSYNNEVVYQFGSFGNLAIQAFTISVLGEYTFDFISDKTVLGLKTEVISGDKNPNDTTLNTFDALYPRGAYFGRVAKFGPSNLIDAHPYLNFNKRNYYFELDYDAFWRYAVSDGVYGAALLLDFPSTNHNPFIGQQIGTLMGCNINNHLNIEFETNIIFPGDFLKTNKLTSTLFHAVMTAEFKF